MALSIREHLRAPRPGNAELGGSHVNLGNPPNCLRVLAPAVASYFYRGRQAPGP